jgi:hypothetical protein
MKDVGNDRIEEEGEKTKIPLAPFFKGGTL